ncbi:MAG: hypothetical protein ETSY2_24460 [Candidatus Entotheonella gemina]|uniref:Uncharacterized protein n=1 Tax=Candidatus Entotheonella gemina TaxID=1429439 RepID=W4M5G6_9BACT|nr:MAG: hypothetical protein ETSY2_24460 [Candidatus Entotheonella gemina]
MIRIDVEVRDLDKKRTRTIVRKGKDDKTQVIPIINENL